MSHIRCPVCRKDSAVSTFNPESLDRDIYVRQAIGKGYGGGFDHGPDTSVLGDDFFTPKIMNRTIDLLNLFLEEGIITPRELMAKLGIGVPITGTDKIMSYEDLLTLVGEINKSLRQRNKILENKIKTSSRRRFTDRVSEEYTKKNTTNLSKTLKV